MNAVAGEVALKLALSPWERRLTFEALARWLIRGAIAGLATASAVLLVGWLTPVPEATLRPWAFEAGFLLLAASAVVALSPRRHVAAAADLDQRLKLDDRLATAWAFRDSEEPITRLQRADAVTRLQQRAPERDLRWSPARPELIVLGVTALTTLLLAITPSPQQAVLDQQAAQALAVQHTSQRLDALRQQADASAALTPDQQRQLDELLQQAQGELTRAHTPQDASNVLSKTQDQVTQQLADPNADLRDEALAAMSEALAAEPQTQALATALQHEDPQAASQAIQGITSHADQLSDVERQALSRALQRAANVGRSDPRTATALRDASQALSAGTAAQPSLSQMDAAVRESIEASQSQAAVKATIQQIHELQSRLASGQPIPSDTPQALGSNGTQPNGISGTPVALDGATGSRTVTDPSSGQGANGAGVGASSSGYQGEAAPDVQAAENVFVPGRPSDVASTQQDQVDQPFSVRGAPRPYRDVLSEYAQSSRDYVDRPDISPAVRDLVKQYFQELESGQ